jgi:two-component system phosphate regulon sensor histidine kinase PhoR
VTSALAVALVISSLALKQFHLRQAEQSLNIQALLISQNLQPLLEETGAQPQLQQRCRELARMVGSRLTIVGRDGTVLADSRGVPESMDNHADRPEIQAAQLDGVGSSQRYSRTLEQDMFYLAVNVADTDVVVRVSLSLSAMATARHRMEGRLFLSGLVLALAAGLVSVSVSRRITRPLQLATAGAQRLAEGDLSARLPVPEQAEVGRLVATLNDMAERLSLRMREVEDQRQKEDTILASMVEGLVAIDVQERVIKVNRAAAHLLRESTEDPAGRRIEEAFRHTGLLRFLRRVLAGEDGLEEELVVPGEQPITLNLLGSVLRNGEGTAMGAVAVVHDISRVRRLEDMRREFVANVSHELKTPVTSIRGFVETLQDGGLSDSEEAHRFLDIIDRQTRRLHAIIEDLLTLSSLEEQAGLGDSTMALTPLAPVLETAVQLCHHAAMSRDVCVSVRCPENLEVRMNAPLMEQAVLNLIDNAVKYGRKGGEVQIQVSEEPDGVAIAVRDEGDGISQDHLPHLFERFYRVDKARTRKEGGTGLCLSIVKHIAHVHGGKVAVTSRVGTGSVFQIILPSSRAD